MTEENVIVVEENGELSSGKNQYQIIRRKPKRSVLNLLLLQVGICLAVSLGVFVVRALMGGASVTASTGFFDFITV